MSPFDNNSPFYDRFPQLERESEAVCIFRCFQNGFHKEPFLTVFDPLKSSVFSGENVTLQSILTQNSLLYFREKLKTSAAHYIILLSKDQRPFIVVTTLAKHYGFCLAAALNAPPESVLPFFRTMPNIRYEADPSFSHYPISKPLASADYARLGATFRRLFSFFESSYESSFECTDPTAFFRLLRMKMLHMAESIGLDPHFLLQTVFAEPMRPQLQADMDLFSASVLILFFAAQRYATENLLRIVFICVDRCPAICVHFRVGSTFRKDLPLLKLLKAYYDRAGCYFTLCTGEHARKESEKIPGVGHMVQHDRSLLTEHALCVFSPIKRNWTEYINHAPIFRLPEAFYEGFPYIGK